MARGSRSSPAAHNGVALPKVEFEVVKEESWKDPAGVHDNQARSYGYNDFSEFRKPDHYIRHIEPLESDLARQVEYDMDEQDKEWLDTVNNERKKEQLDRISYEVFEIVMDRLEKEWFDLTKNIPKPEFAMPSEDSTCAICDDSEGENSNAIVFCDGCNLAVHQDCYGVPYIPEGQWLCRKCTVSPENPVRCILCPNEGGAFKQTVHGEWVHLLCAIWVPETRVANEVFMEPITGIERISKQRWKLKCTICDLKEGASIQCAKTSCFRAFHVTCARKEKFLMPMKAAHGSEPVTLTCFCEKHLPKEQQDARLAALKSDESRVDHTGANGSPTNKQLSNSKSARAYAKTYKPGPPLVPALIVNRIMHYIGKVTMRKKLEFIQLMSRYWSLKREARRGAPLLKRLHLEPWTASQGGIMHTEEEKIMKLEQLRRLQHDLIKVRTLALLTRKRESRKLKQAELIHRVLSEALFPHEPTLRLAFERITSFDRNDYFKNPVSKTDVPDYFDIIKKPMCWSFIDAKLNRHEYWDIKSFRDDIDLVIDNAILYNKPGTPFQKTALRIRVNAKPVLDDLAKLSTAALNALPGANRNGHPPEMSEHHSGVNVHLPETNKHFSVVNGNPPETDGHTPAVNGNPVETNEHPLVVNGNPPETNGDSREINENTPETDDHPQETPTELGTHPMDVDSVLDQQTLDIGDLEPPMDVLELLLSSDAIKDDLPMELDDPPIVSLFNYEFARMKPPPPRPPRRAPPKGKKSRKDRDIANEKRRQQRLAEKEAAIAAQSSEGPMELKDEADKEKELQALLDNSPGFRAPRTRRNTAASDGDEQSVSAAGSPTPETASAPIRRKRRPPISLPSHPQVVDDVDSKKSFNMFNAGWILPPEQKRGGRKAVEKFPIQPLQKKRRIDQGSSRLSIVSTPASENQTLWPESYEQYRQSEHPHPKVEDPMDVDIPQAGPSHPQSTPISGSLPPLTGDEIPSHILQAPNGTLIFEELDTPATRRLKAMRRKAERERLAAAAAGGESEPDITEEHQVVATLEGNAKIPVVAEQEEAESETEPLEDNKPTIPASPDAITQDEPSPTVEHDAEESLSSVNSVPEMSSPAKSVNEDAPGRRTSSRHKKAVFDSQPALEDSEDNEEQGLVRLGDKLEEGTLVWAKFYTFPWWPAVVHNDDSPKVPPAVLKSYKAAVSKRKKKAPKLYLIQFFDKTKSWQFLPYDRLRLLKENSSVDSEFLASSGPKQRGKTPKVVEECRMAYRAALAFLKESGGST